MSHPLPATEASKTLSSLLHKYHSLSAARKRLRAARLEAYGPLSAVYDDLTVIAEIAAQTLDSRGPRISVVIPVYNEEVELIPTILSLLWAVTESKIPTEIVAVDNLSIRDK